ncbi:unnamed protein product [Mortierella alpina]
MSLVDYRSSSDEECEAAGSHLQNADDSPCGTRTQGKRSLPNDTLVSKDVSAKKTKIALPPLPSTLTELYKERERPQDNPEKHQGRVRSRAHVDGSWPVHVYLEVKVSEELFDIIKSLTRSARSLAPSTVSMLRSIESLRKAPSVAIDAETAADATELHISLTRPLYLQELHIGRFTSDVRDAFRKRKRFNVSFSGVQSFSNEDNTRSFLSLRVGSGHAELEGLVAEMDKIAERYCQPAFYPDPQFHASFAWALGGDVLSEKTVEGIPELLGELGHDLRHCSVMVRRVAWKTGQKIGTVPLS